ncbi:LRR receptor-like serine threonine-protein kinase, partial [Musa troglodytarum]
MGGRSLLVIVFSLVVLCIELEISDGFSMIRCQETERKALMEFKQRLRDPSHRLSSWVGEDCCSWEGIRCSNVTGHVIELHLRNRHRLEVLSLGWNYLYGQTLDSIAKLTNLRALDLSIPTSLGNLSSLRSLFLYSNDLNGSIAEGIGGLKGLNYLVLSYNSFRLSELHLVNLSSLKYLDISYNYIDLNKGDEWIPPFQLRSLYMTFCQIVPRPHFPRWLRLQTTLRDLSLSSTSIKERIPNWLPSSLEYLSLSNNEISGDVPQYLPNLMYLDLSNNSLTDHLSPRILNMMPSLQFLDLSNNKIPGFIVGFWTICGSILLNSRWRIAYFQAIDNMCDELYVVLVLNVAMFKRKLM